MDYISILIIIILIALLPWICFYCYYSKLRRSQLKLFLLGGIGWLAALILRVPILTATYPILDITIQITIAATLAGVFEESFRFLFAKSFLKGEIKNEDVLSFGIGWGVVEILILHTLTMVILLIAVIYNIPEIPVPPLEKLISEGFAGAFERIIAVALHVALTILIVKSLKNKILFLFAIIYHALVDFIAGFGYYVFDIPIWSLEFLFVILTLILYGIIHVYLKKDVRDFFLKPEEPF